MKPFWANHLRVHKEGRFGPPETKYRPRLELLEGRLLLTALPDGFTDTLVATGIQEPTAMAFAPDGRLFVCEQGGNLRIIKNGTLLARPFLNLDVETTGQRGLLGVAFHPRFLTGSPFVYVYYTVPTAPVHHRVSYFVASGDQAVLGSEHVVIDLDNSSGNTSLNGGAIHFGSDGKLYVATGQGATPQNSQALRNLHGKMLRLNPDGSVPPDNPFVGIPRVRPEIWASGLRNPFTFAVQPGTQRIYVNDVGSGLAFRSEEINYLSKGANYGWPFVEGYTRDGEYASPLFAYNMSFGGDNCSITGGVFYNPTTITFPKEYIGKYFFADFCAGWIYRIHPDAPNPAKTATPFATGISPGFIVDLKVDAGGSLYYLGRDNGGFVSRIDYVGRALKGVPPLERRTSPIVPETSPRIDETESFDSIVAALAMEPPVPPQVPNTGPGAVVVGRSPNTTRQEPLHDALHLRSLTE
jgi:glucose/arabinose dehydrogenase